MPLIFRINKKKKPCLLNPEIIESYRKENPYDKPFKIQPMNFLNRTVVEEFRFGKKGDKREYKGTQMMRIPKVKKDKFLLNPEIISEFRIKTIQI